MSWCPSGGHMGYSSACGYKSEDNKDAISTCDNNKKNKKITWSCLRKPVKRLTSNKK